MKKNFRFGFSVGDIVSGVSLGLLVEIIRPWASTARGKYFAQVLVETRLKSGPFSL